MLVARFILPAVALFASVRAHGLLLARQLELPPAAAEYNGTYNSTCMGSCGDKVVSDKAVTAEVAPCEAMNVTLDRERCTCKTAYLLKIQACLRECSSADVANATNARIDNNCAVALKDVKEDEDADDGAALLRVPILSLALVGLAVLAGL